MKVWNVMRKGTELNDPNNYIFWLLKLGHLLTLLHHKTPKNCHLETFHCQEEHLGHHHCQKSVSKCQFLDQNWHLGQDWPSQMKIEKIICYKNLPSVKEVLKTQQKISCSYFYSFGKERTSLQYWKLIDIWIYKLWIQRVS